MVGMEYLSEQITEGFQLQVVYIDLLCAHMLMQQQQFQLLKSHLQYHSSLLP